MCLFLFDDAPVVHQGKKGDKLQQTSSLSPTKKKYNWHLILIRLRINMLWSIYYISVIFNKEIFNNYIFEGKKTWWKNIICEKQFPKSQFLYNLCFRWTNKKKLSRTMKPQKTNVSFVSNQTNKIKCTYTPNIEW